ncbi:cryptochrome/photolyase family protein [Aestuariibius insulae]|uniref:cryptochrome/photolyase family protein n=1 Tax=Aestuariibius insulae TaxID=2058287 RepID=UPI00345E0F4E
MTDKKPVLTWFRRDLRLGDHPALTAACESGRPVIPIFLYDEVAEGQGAAPRFRLGLGLKVLNKSLESKASRLIFRRGEALQCLRDLIKETDAGAVYWSRLYDPASKARDIKVKEALKQDGIDARSFSGHLLFEPWQVETKSGGFYKVYSPMWRAVKDTEIGSTLPTPSRIPAPQTWPSSEILASWEMSADMQRGADIVRSHCMVGESAAASRLGAFIVNGISNYAEARNLPAQNGTSNLSENLAYGEISPRSCWHAGMQARQEGKAGAETWLKELVWREFAYHLIHHTPHIVHSSWREEWGAFPWKTDERLREVKAWKQGRTGIRFVDAAMREMYVTGRMHNRARMIVASYLTKHLLCHWKIGLDWFEEHLIDWDPASNALGWQWSAGSGPDATPYFRVFNPVTQLDKFDKDRAYVSAWIAEEQGDPPQTALDYFHAIPEQWSMSASDPYPDPIVTAEDGRKRALNAYENRDF